MRLSCAPFDLCPRKIHATRSCRCGTADRRPVLHEMRVLSAGTSGWCAALICTCAGFLTVTRTVPSAGTGSPSRRGWPGPGFTAAGPSAPSRPACRLFRRVYVRIPDMDPQSVQMAFRIARVSGVRPGGAFRYPDSPEVAA